MAKLWAWVCLALPLATHAQSNPTKTITTAARDGDIQTILDWLHLDKHKFLDWRDTWQKTPMHYAAEYGHADIVSQLKKKGADIHAVDYRKRTPLLFAAAAGNTEAVNTILDLDPSTIEAYDEQGRTALHYAAEQGHHQLLKSFMDKISYDQPQAGTGKTALMIAAERSNYDFINVILKKGADIDAADIFGTTAMHFAAKMGHEDVVIMLAQHGANIVLKDRKLRTILHYGAMSGQTDMLRGIINTLGAQGKNVDEYIRAEDTDGQTALHYVARNGVPACVKYLLDKGADVNQPDKLHQTPLHMAIRLPETGFAAILEYKRPIDANHYEVVDILIKFGANLDALSKQKLKQHTPLSRAIEYGCTKTVKRLLRGHKNDDDSWTKANINRIVSKMGYMHHAIDSGNLHLMDNLVRGGIDVLQRTAGGKETPLMFAVKQNKFRAVEKMFHYKSESAGRSDIGLETPDANERSPLVWAVIGGRIDIVKLLLAHGADLNSHSEGKKITPLHYAAGAGDIEILRALISRGADQFSIDESNSSPLATAAYYNQTEVVHVLLKSMGTTDQGLDFPLLMQAYSFAMKKGNDKIAEDINVLLSGAAEEYQKITADDEVFSHYEPDPEIDEQYFYGEDYGGWDWDAGLPDYDLWTSEDGGADAKALDFTEEEHGKEK